MFTFTIHVDPWDMEDGGVDDVLDRLKGELGVTGVSVTAASSPVCILRRNRTASPRIFRSRGGLFFQPNTTKYAHTRIKPPSADWIKTRNPLARVADACSKRDLTFGVVIDSRRLETVLTRHPECATKSAFGDASQTRLCPQHPDAAEFLRSLIADLVANYQPGRIEIRDLGSTFESDPLPADELDAIGPVGADLFAVCFCESCLQSAAGDDVLVDAARTSVQKHLTRAMDAGRPLQMSPESFLAGDEIVRAYIQNRRAAHVLFLDSIREKCAADFILHADAYPTPFDPPVETLAAHCDRVLLGTGAMPASSQESPKPPAGTKSDCLIDLRSFTDAEPATLVKRFKQLVDSGFAGVVLDHLGLMTESTFTNARQAIRYAKREAKTAT